MSHCLAESASRNASTAATGSAAGVGTIEATRSGEGEGVGSGGRRWPDHFVFSHAPDVPYRQRPVKDCPSSDIVSLKVPPSSGIWNDGACTHVPVSTCPFAVPPICPWSVS